MLSKTYCISNNIICSPTQDTIPPAFFILSVKTTKLIFVTDINHEQWMRQNCPMSHKSAMQGQW